MAPHESNSKARKREGHVPERTGDHSGARTLSCSECRRLKLRCDRQWPCQSCVKRGCASICPNGSLTPGGGGNRFILHGSEQLHQKIEQMSDRIQQLEDMIELMWIHKTDGKMGAHPLLRPELLKIKQMPDTQNAADAANPLLTQEQAEAKDIVVKQEDAEVDCVQHLVGTLTLGENGVSQYLGRSARIDLLLKTEEDEDENFVDTSPESMVSDNFSSDPSTFDPATLPLEIRNISQSLIFSVPPDCPVTVDTLKAYLPPLARAWSLCETFFEHSGWFHKPMRREDFVRDIFSPFYGGASKVPDPYPSGPDETTRTPGAHELALLYIIFAIGEVADLTQSVVQNLSRKYIVLAKAALCLENPFKSGGTTVIFISCLSMLTFYTAHWDQRTDDLDATYAWVGLAARMGVSLGLHRDGSKWGLSDKEMQTRRSCFWETYTMDVWSGLSLGRPPTIDMRYVDCKFPDAEENKDENGNSVLRNFQHYKFKFLRDCILPVMDHIFSVKPFTYGAVHELDQKIRTFDMGNLSSDLGENPTPGAVMERHICLCIREWTLLYVHRSFFTRVLYTNPENPLESPYAASVLATFRCAVTLLQILKSCYEKQPALTARFSMPWTLLLTSAVIAGTICTRGPRTPAAPAAFHQLKIAVEIFESARAYSPRSTRVMPIVYRLRAKAHEAIISVGPGPTNKLPAAGKLTCPLSAKDVDPEDELIAYSGKARVVRQTSSAHRQSSASSGSPASSKFASPKSVQQLPGLMTMGEGDLSSPSPAYPPSLLPTTDNANSPGWPTLSGAVLSSVSSPLDYSPFVAAPTPAINPFPTQVQNNYQLDYTPYDHFTQESINPSSLPMANVVPSNTITNGPTIPSGGDFGWLDGFGVGAPMDQFPIVGNQSASYIFSGDSPGSSASDPNINTPDFGMGDGFAFDSSVLPMDANAGGIDEKQWQEYVQKLFVSGIND